MPDNTKYNYERYGLHAECIIIATPQGIDFVKVRTALGEHFVRKDLLTPLDATPSATIEQQMRTIITLRIALEDILNYAEAEHDNVAALAIGSLAIEALQRVK